VVALKRGAARRLLLTQENIDRIEDIVSLNPLFSLRQIKEKLLEIDKVKMSISTIKNALGKLMIILKQVHRELDRVNSHNLIKLRREYSLWFNECFRADFSKVIFVDECRFNNQIRRSHGRSLCGTRVNISIPVLRGRNITLISSISLTSLCYTKVVTESTVNANIFNKYIEELCIYLKDVKRMEDGFIILDNARVHSPSDLQKIASQFGFTVKFLSPYSYMLNPIENSFSKIKTAVRRIIGVDGNGI